MLRIGESIDEDAIKSFRETAEDHGYRTARPGSIEEVTVYIGSQKDDMDVHKEIADRVVDEFGVTDDWVAGRVPGGGPDLIRVYVRSPCSDCGDRPVQTQDGLCKKCHPDETYLH